MSVIVRWSFGGRPFIVVDVAHVKVGGFDFTLSYCSYLAIFIYIVRLLAEKGRRMFTET